MLPCNPDSSQRSKNRGRLTPFPLPPPYAPLPQLQLQLQLKLTGSYRKRYPFHTGQSAPVIIGTYLIFDKIPLNYHSKKLFNVYTAKTLLYETDTVYALNQRVSIVKPLARQLEQSANR